MRRPPDVADLAAGAGFADAAREVGSKRFGVAGLAARAVPALAPAADAVPDPAPDPASDSTSAIPTYPTRRRSLLDPIYGPLKCQRSTVMGAAYGRHRPPSSGAWTIDDAVRSDYL